MDDRTIFEAHDAITLDSIVVSVSGQRVEIETAVEGEHRLFVLVRPGDGLRLGRALVEALEPGDTIPEEN